MSLLGFFGIAPDVQIKIKDFAKPLDLSFVLMGGSGDARGKLELQLRDAANKVLLSTPPNTIDVTGQSGKRLQTAIQIAFTYPGPGKYSFVMLLDGARHFEAPFELQLGTAVDFQA